MISNYLDLIWIQICFVILLNQTLVCDVSALSVSDICEYVEKQQIYCNCDNQGVDEAREVTCFILDINGLNRSSPVWNGFKLQKNITSLMFTTRFDKNKLTFLPVSALRNVADTLQTLNINEMKLGHLESNSIINFPKINKISLESNDIRGLSAYCFAHLPALKSLSISSNSIEVLKSGVFIDLPKLEELFLDRNRLKTIEDNTFAEMKSVRELDLRLNEINAITSSTFSGLTGLKRLDLSLNKLKSIPSNALIGAPLLRELDLSKNQIETIDENAFQNMSHLMSIQLIENKIRYLSTQVFKGSPNLLLVDLSSNLLETIRNELISDLQHLNEEAFVFYLRDNRLQCDCRLLWLKNITHETFGLLFRREFKHYKCVFTKELADFKVEDEIKILELVKTQTFIDWCEPKTANQPEIEDILDVETVSESKEKALTYDKANQMSANHSTIEMGENKIDSDPKQKEIHSTQSLNESLTKETQKITNDVNEEKKNSPDISLVKASQERTRVTDSGHSLIDQNNKIVFSFVFAVYLFCKNNLMI